MENKKLGCQLSVPTFLDDTFARYEEIQLLEWISCMSKGTSRNGTRFFGVLDWKGLVIILKGSPLKVHRVLKVSTKEKDGQPFSFMEFSPNATKFLVSMERDNVIHLFETYSCKKTQTFRNENSTRIVSARWITEELLLGSYDSVYKMLLFKIGETSPLMYFSPKELINSIFLHFEVFKDKKSVVCGTNKGTVLKMSIESSDEELSWEYKTPETISSVAISNNQKLVCFANHDGNIQLLCSKTGSILSKLDYLTAFSKSNDKLAKGVAFCPNDQFIFSWSSFNMILARINSENSMEIFSKQSTTIAEIGFLLINTAVIFWGKFGDEKETERAFIIVGGFNGRLNRIYLEE